MGWSGQAPEHEADHGQAHEGLDGARGFEPATSTRRFRLAIPHPTGPTWALAAARTNL
jgi:hypothetical protein